MIRLDMKKNIINTLLQRVCPFSVIYHDASSVKSQHVRKSRPKTLREKYVGWCTEYVEWCALSGASDGKSHFLLA